MAHLYDAREARSVALVAAASLSGLGRDALLTDPDAPLTIEGIERAVDELAAGRPVQYVTGRTEFCGRTFRVAEGVLIPRPETEELVAWVADEVPPGASVLDVGTGSGCIAASVALARRDVRVFAVDLSPAALRTAEENCRRLGARVTIGRADALASLCDRRGGTPSDEPACGGVPSLEEVFAGERFDAIVSNPPYVPERDRKGMHVNVLRYEPSEALFVPDDDPLRFYRAIARSGQRVLRAEGRLYFEIYSNFADAVCRLLREEGYAAAEVRKDIYGKARMICGRKR